MGAAQQHQNRSSQNENGFRNSDQGSRREHPVATLITRSVQSVQTKRPPVGGYRANSDELHLQSRPSTGYPSGGYPLRSTQGHAGVPENRHASSGRNAGYQRQDRGRNSFGSGNQAASARSYARSSSDDSDGSDDLADLFGGLTLDQVTREQRGPSSLSTQRYEEAGRRRIEPPSVLSAQLREEAARRKRVPRHLQRYDQLQFKHSTQITGFSSHSSCAKCFIEQYRLNLGVVKNMYTSNDFFKDLNFCLMNSSNMQGDRGLKMYTLLLSDAICKQNSLDCSRGWKPPQTLYRGVAFDSELCDFYKRHVGAVIYYFAFTSTSSDLNVARGFAHGGPILVIHGATGTECVADVSAISCFPAEREHLISANMGFEIRKVELEARPNPLIHLLIVNDKGCRKSYPRGKFCNVHSDW